jgi:hypothetical protein
MQVMTPIDKNRTAIWNYVVFICPRCLETKHVPVPVERHPICRCDEDDEDDEDDE